jgi:hypothetical protein
VADWTNLTNRFNKSTVSMDSLEAVKDHINQFLFIGGEDKGVVDLKLDIVGDETLSADSDVTDHYVESNIAYQDQISLKPKVYTINGEVGELVWYQKDKYSQALGQVAQRLEGVISFLPVRSRSFNQMKTTVMKAAQWVDTFSNAASKISNLSTIGSNQQQAYMRLLEFRDSRMPIMIKTPWGVLENYVITNLKFTQPKETKDKSIISITLKEFRTTQVSTVKYNADKYQRNAALERQPAVDNGKTIGEDVSLETHEITTEGNYKFEDIEGGVVWDACDMPDSNYSAMFSDEYGFSAYNRATKSFISSSDPEYSNIVSWGTEQCKLGIGDIK